MGGKIVYSTKIQPLRGCGGNQKSISTIINPLRGYDISTGMYIGYQ